MMISRRPLRSATLRFDTATCLLCQWRSFSNSFRRPAEKEAPAVTATRRTSGPLDDAPRAHGRIVSDFTPKPLSRPIGLPNPPRAGENTGIDSRTLRQRRDDFVNYDKHLIRRKELTQKISTPYFREWSNMRLHKGKSFLAPPRLFKAERALYFPNFYGQTLRKDKGFRDTTLVLENKISVVSVFSSAWAENQAATFVSEENNPELHNVVKKSRGVAQMVQINVEENALKAWIVRLFMGRLRKRMGEHNLGRYFLVRRGITNEIRDAVGLLNSKVGYTYLLDGECRIRWAGSGNCEGDEKEGLVKGTRRLIEELETKRKEKPTPLPSKKALDTSEAAEKHTNPGDMGPKGMRGRTRGQPGGR